MYEACRPHPGHFPSCNQQTLPTSDVGLQKDMMMERLPSREDRVTRGKMSSSPILKDNDFERRGLAGSTGSDDDSNSSSEPAQEPARNPRRSKSVSFAANVNFDPELKPRSSEWNEMLWEAFFLLLLVALALLAPAGQAIAHVNDIILLYAGGRPCCHLYSLFALLAVG